VDNNTFDRATRALAAGASRRKVLRTLLGGAAVAATGVLGVERSASADEACRESGHPCEGNQTCCVDLSCIAGSGQGAAERCCPEGFIGCSEGCIEDICGGSCDCPTTTTTTTEAPTTTTTTTTEQPPACREEGHPCEGNQVCCEGLACVAGSGQGAAERCCPEGYIGCGGSCVEDVCGGSCECPTTTTTTTERPPACREEGHPCEGNQECCEGLICVEGGGQGAAARCVPGTTTTTTSTTQKPGTTTSTTTHKPGTTTQKPTGGSTSTGGTTTSTASTLPKTGAGQGSSDTENGAIGALATFAAAAAIVGARLRRTADKTES